MVLSELEVYDDEEEEEDLSLVIYFTSARLLFLSQCKQMFSETAD